MARFNPPTRTTAQNLGAREGIVERVFPSRGLHVFPSVKPAPALQSDGSWRRGVESISCMAGTNVPTSKLENAAALAHADPQVPTCIPAMAPQSPKSRVPTVCVPHSTQKAAKDSVQENVPADLLRTLCILCHPPCRLSCCLDEGPACLHAHLRGRLINLACQGPGRRRRKRRRESTRAAQSRHPSRPGTPRGDGNPSMQVSVH